MKMKSISRAVLSLSSLSFFVVAVAPRAFPADEEGFKPIFNGRDLDGWDGNPKFWSVEKGTIVGRTTAENPTQGNTFIVWRNGEVDDFELRLEFRIHGGNSGIQFRSFEDEKGWGRWVIGGYQADFDAGDQIPGALYGERYRGMLAERGQKTVIGKDHKPRTVGSLGDPKEIGASIKREDWNEYRIEARGNRIRLSINGRPTAEADDEDGEARRSGLIALQLHAGPPMKVEFRDLRLKRFKLEDRKKVVLVAGEGGHGLVEHAHKEGCRLLARCLNESGLPVLATVYGKGWPADPTAFDNADAVALYCNGGDGHMVIPRLDEVDLLMKKGTGLACLHYAVEVPKGKPGDRFLDWTGGYFEQFWSVNPSWTADFTRIPDHPIARGVKPFKIDDEWYYHMRFVEKAVPILSAVPPDSTRDRPDGPHSGNAQVRARKGMDEVVAWALERADGGRGFGITGGHFHRNWENEDFRKVVLNALAWIAKVEVPPEGVPSKTAREDRK